MTLAFLALLGAPYIYDISSLRVKTPDDGQWICPKRVEFFTKIKWGIVHLVGFYYSNISRCTVLWMSNSLLMCVGITNVSLKLSSPVINFFRPQISGCQTRACSCACVQYVIMYIFNVNVALGLAVLEGKRQETQNFWYEHQLHWLSHEQIIGHIFVKISIILTENKVIEPTV